MEKLKVVISQVPSSGANALAEQLGIELLGVEALDIEPLKWSYSETAHTRECWVVTSKNARSACVQAYTHHSGDCLQVECVGVTTGQYLIDAGLPVKHIGKKASDLLQNRNEDGYEAVRFFCGTSRRNTIMNRAEELGVSYAEEVVYRSLPTYTQVEGDNWVGAIFTSPLATESVLKKNKINRNIPVMAMGETTAEVVKSFGFETVLTPTRPSVVEILQEFNSYLRR